ncbi:MAG: tail fiber domain-containing protein [Patescibacteria group bacterium]
MTIRHFSIITAIAVTLAMPFSALAQTYTGPTATPPGNNPNGPVWLSPSSQQTGSINISGGQTIGQSDTIGGDIYMTSSKAIRLDVPSGSSILNVGNWGAGGTGFEFDVYGNLVIKDQDKAAPYNGLLVVPQICLNNTGSASTNCITTWPSGGSGTIGGSGTLGTVPLFTPNGTTLGNSSITQSGNNISVNGVIDDQGVNNGDGTYTYYRQGTWDAQGAKNDGGWGLSVGGLKAGQYTKLYFYTNGTEKMRIDSAGNVGIGTASPARRLDVTSASSNAIRGTASDGTSAGVNGVGFTGLYGNGGAYGVQGYGSANGVYGYGDITGVHGNGTTYGLYGDGGAYGVYGTGSSYSFYGAGGVLYNSGNVGIGTTNPTLGKLQVNVGVNQNLVVRTVGSETTLEAVNDAYSADVPLRIYASQLLIPNGNVGIGTLYPGGKLGVVASGAGNVAISGVVDGGIGVNGQSTAAGGSGVYAQNSSVSGVTYGVQATVASPSGYAVYANNTSGSGGYSVYAQGAPIAIDQSTFGGTAGLYIIGSTVGNSNWPNLGFGIKNTSGAIVQGGSIFASNGNTAGSEWQDISISTKPSTGAMAERMRITSSGNVGIGTTAPTQKLQIGNLTQVSTATPDTISLGATYSNVAGNNTKMRVWEDGANYGGIGVSPNQIDYRVWAGGDHVFYETTTQLFRIVHSTGNATLKGTLTQNSDLEFKKDISKLTRYGIDQIMELNPVSYVMKDDPDDTTQIGFIAQDVKKIMPEFVAGTALSDGGTGLSLNYSGMVTVLTKGMQDQQHEIDALKAKNEDLEKRLDALEAKLK